MDAVVDVDIHINVMSCEMYLISSICELNEAQNTLKCDFHVYTTIIPICVGLFAAHFVYM